MDPVIRELIPLPGSPGLGRMFRSPASAPTARRLVVFLHGFNGRAVKTWRAFDNGANQSLWWSESDLAFVGYDSLRREINGVASYLRQWLSTVNGLPGQQSEGQEAFSQLVLVGHSLGGVILRRMLLDDYTSGPVAGSLTHSPGFSTKLALFSPATAGFGPSGWMGVVRETGLWGVAQAVLSGSAAFNALTRPSTGILAELRHATGIAMAEGASEQLAAPTMWADPDGVIVVQPYAGDPPSVYMPGRNHTNVCKPNDNYPDPRTFVEGVAG